MTSDHLGSPRDVVDSGGALRVHTEFDTFGRIVGQTHFDASGLQVTAGAPGHFTIDFLYTGKLFDFDTGLQNNLNRWYDSATGRWLSEDPIGFAAGDANLSRYAGNAATMFVDPDGLKYGVVPNAAVWVEESDGTVHKGTTGQDLEDIVNDIYNRGGQMSRCIVKGHGSDIMVSEQPEADPMIAVTTSEDFAKMGLRGKPGVITIDGDPRDVTDKMKEITGPGTSIELRGCSTGPAAKKISSLLPEITVYGTPTPVFGIPGTTLFLGPPGDKYIGGKYHLPTRPRP